jgi:hypothetical protein
MKAYMAVCAYLDRNLLNVSLDELYSTEVVERKGTNIACPTKDVRMTYASKNTERAKP